MYIDNEPYGFCDSTINFGEMGPGYTQFF
jgi:Cytosolic domain of 10TM putative phosphate transporter